MKRAAPHARGQGELLDWRPTDPVERFEDHVVRAATLGGRVSRALAAALDDCGLSREDVAAQASDVLGSRLTKNMIDAYASQAREEHRISVERLIAVLHVIRDRRVLEALAEPLGWAVIDRKYLSLIELASLREHEAELRGEIDAKRRAARAKGIL